MRLASVMYRSGLAPSIYAAKQAVVHRHVRVDGRIVDRPGYQMRPGQVAAIDPEKSPSLAAIAQKTDAIPPQYLEVDKENCKVTIARQALLEEIPANVEIMRVVEYYAR